MRNPNGDGNDEKIKPFRLVKYFTYSSLVVLFAGALVISVLNTHWSRRLQLDKMETYHQFLVRNLSHQISTQFILPVKLRFGRILLRNPEQFELMDRVVRRAVHSFPVDAVTIYDSQFNIVSYSFDHDLIGRTGIGGEGYHAAIEGQLTSRMVQQGHPIARFLGMPRQIKILTHAPLRLDPAMSGDPGNPVIGVVELTQDLSDEYREIVRFQILVILSISLVMAVLFIVLVFVVKRGEAIIERRAQERITLKERLGRAEHLSRLGEMVATVSHEIRNPLGIIRSSAALLQKKLADPDPGAALAGIIHEESGRLDGIITDFLDYARPKPPDLRPIYLQSVLEKSIEFFRPQLRDAGIAVTGTIGPGLPQVSGDAAMLHQTFLNLLINALQAMPAGGTLDCRAVRQGPWVVVTIEDSGPGIAPELLRKVWDPFFTTKEKGTGLGLVIVRNIVEAHGGRIDLANRDGGGLRVTMALPLATQNGGASDGNGTDRR
jgi:signal transduction histidine kinase